MQKLKSTKKKKNLKLSLLCVDATLSSFSNELDLWMRTGIETQEFRRLIAMLSFPRDLRRVDWRSLTGERSANICVICQSALNAVINIYRNGTSVDEIRSKGIKFCVLLNIETEEVCNGTITLNLPTILHIIDARPDLTGSTICGILLESDSCPLNDTRFEWSVDINRDPPKLIDADEVDETLNIIQITDIHYDPNYEPYGKSQCDQPICCRKGQNSTNTSDKVAGYWGDYNYCDSPWHAVVDLLDHIRDTHRNISYVYFTGDIVDHGVWETSIEGNVEILNRSYGYIHDTFRNVPVYPILGNHEPHPVNQFAPIDVTNDEINAKWLYSMMADLWINFGWLPESTRSTILSGGYYTVSPKRGFRIIALNNNVCYIYNWWLWYQPEDPDGQLRWLEKTLWQAEKDSEFVHILAHVPAGNECQKTWRREYLKIVNRYAHIIQAQFNGHTHNDELLLYYDDDTRINNVAWNGGSATAFTNLNPNYKLYTVHSTNYMVTDFETWMYNLSLANENATQRPLWYKSYSFKAEYDIPHLSYNSLSDWFLRLKNDDDLLNRYYRNFFKLAEPSLKRECDSKCKRTYACRIIASLKDEATRCIAEKY